MAFRFLEIRALPSKFLSRRGILFRKISLDILGEYIYINMMKKKHIILFAVVLYTGVFLCHDAIFREDSFLYKNIYSSKVASLVSNSQQSKDNTVSKLFTHHKCSFCDGFVNDAEVQKVPSIDLFKEKLFGIFIPSYIVLLLIGNPKRAPPSI